MSGTTLTPRSHEVLTRVEAWAHRGPVRAVVVKVGVSIVGPLLLVAGVAMLVLPGPGLVVMALGAALLALEYEWARRVLLSCGRVLDKGRRSVLPTDASLTRRILGVATTVGFLVATTGITAAVTTYVGSTFV
ncbi:PGPGW domain-containing protein [Nocardioides sp. P5_C9_2]